MEISILIEQCKKTIESRKAYIARDEQELKDVDQNYKRFTERSNIKTALRRKLEQMRGKLYEEQKRLKNLEAKQSEEKN